ncbi:2-desacetyl-2-hydroxyethyl bacteriochlorophyllide A dehydrogenase [Ruaniaceae bacterium KH17]|nr:2-desacetyl-2-hydroxyethyl bacteriochlorophyllide A dehydrogenase [Ruaniaceae bacterium KH17]
MKQVFADELNHVVVREVAVPEPSVGEVRVRTIYAGICGSDTHGVAGQHAFLAPPYVPGHEATGVVDSVGEGVDESVVGQRIMLKPNIKCGECIPCLEDRSNACQTLRWIGCDITGKLPGAMSEFFVAPADYVYPISDAVTDEQAALIECFATPIHAARIAGDLKGKKVVVLGAGTIGVLQVIAARAAGADAIVATDLEASKRDRAVRLGATGAVDGSAEDFDEQVLGLLGGRADVLFDCVTNARAAQQWTRLVRHGATICIVGVPSGEYPVPMGWIQDWELRIQGCANYNEADVETAIAMADRIPADEIVSAIYPLDEGAEAFAQAAKFTSGKVLVRG